MTAPDLNRLARLRTDRAKLHEQRAEVRSAAGLRSRPLDGMPKAHGGASRHTEKIAAQLADLDAQIREKDLAILQAEKEIQRFISSVPSSRLRLILRYRCVDGLPWADVAKNVGRGETKAAIKVTFSRFIAKLDESPT